MRTILLLLLSAASLYANPFGFTPRIGGTNLVAWWTFNEGAGTVAGDFSGRNNLGTLTNSPAWIKAGLAGSALTFRGTNQFVGMGNPTALNVTNNYTLSAFVWISNAPPSGGGFAIVSKWADTYPRDYCLVLGGTAVSWSNATFFVTTTTNGDTAFTSSTTLTAAMLGKWTHVCCTYDGSNLKLYVNGLLESTKAQATVAASTGTSFQLGRHASGSSYLDGRIDDVRIYNRALTAEEIKQLYNGGAATQQ